MIQKIIKSIRDLYKICRRKIKAYLYKIEVDKKTKEYLKLKEAENITYRFMTIERTDEKENKNYVIIPFNNIDYIHIGDIYDDDYHKYKTRKTIALLGGTKHKIYDKDKVYIIGKNGMVDLLNK